MIDEGTGANISGQMMQTLGALCALASPNPTINEDALTERLITHLRHVDLAVPDYGSQRDF
jgi:hypothetical protein